MFPNGTSNREEKSRIVDNSEPTTQDESIRLWNSHATWWQDEFTNGVDPEYTEQILPLIVDALKSSSSVLDIGAGEGQVSRCLVEAGVGKVVGVDPIASQIDLAVERSNWHGGREPAFARSAADGLPFAEGSFEAAVACLVFEHIDAVDEALAEVSRVLQPGGTFLFLLNHPLLQTPNSGWIDDQYLEPPEQYWRIGDYLHEQETIEEVQKNVFIRFIHRPLSRYVNALSASGFSIEHMNEPAPPTGYLEQGFSYQAAANIPRLLVLRCRRR